jgi:hypothetical protein
MAKMGDGIKGEYDGPPPKDEAEHFEMCPQCGQAVDARDLAQVLQVEAKLCPA